MASALNLPRFSAATAASPQTGMFTIGAGNILAISAGPPCVIQPAQGDKRDSLHIGPAITLLASSGRRHLGAHPDRESTLIDEHALCSLLAFADMSLSRDSAPRGRPVPEIVLQPLPGNYTADLCALKNWLVRQAMDDQANDFLDHLRRREAYLITRYLLQTPELGSVAALCRHYGLSYTHFRRLCSNALGCSTKRQLRAWRAARSALQLIDGPRSLLDVAINNGYASSSHICRDIKQHYGLTPSTIMKAHALLP